MNQQSINRNFTVLLPVLAGLLQIGCLIYCGYFWTPLQMTLRDPDISWACWLYCHALGQGSNPIQWQVLSYTGAFLCIISGLLFRFERRSLAIPASLTGGVILLPVGILALIPAFTQRKDAEVAKK